MEDDALDEEDEHVSEDDEDVGKRVVSVIHLGGGLDDVGQDVSQAGGEEDAAGEGVADGHDPLRADEVAEGEREEATDESFDKDDEQQPNFQVDVRGAVVGGVRLLLVLKLARRLRSAAEEGWTGGEERGLVERDSVVTAVVFEDVVDGEDLGGGLVAVVAVAVVVVVVRVARVRVLLRGAPRLDGFEQRAELGGVQGVSSSSS